MPFSFFNMCRGKDALPAKDKSATAPATCGSALNTAALYDLRKGSKVPNGDCMYIQSGDTSDFDGYLIAAAGEVLQQQTQQFKYVIAVPERRAWRDKDEPDTMKHDPSYLEEVMATAGALLRHLCPKATLTRGLLNQRNIIPWNMMFNEPEKYAPLINGLPKADIKWSSLQSLADDIRSPNLSSVILDMNGSMGYLDGLVQLLGEEGEKVLGQKMAAAGLPVIVMAGIQAEVKALTLPLPGRDPRATKNAIYYPDAVRVLLRIAKNHKVPLLFVTNNACNKLMRFEDAEDVNKQLELQGLLKRISDVWFSMPHLKGKCVPFDWVAFSAMLLYGRRTADMGLATQELYVGKSDPSVLVLKDSKCPEDDSNKDVLAENLRDTELWGDVECVTNIELELLNDLAKHAAKNAAA